MGRATTSNLLSALAGVINRSAVQSTDKHQARYFCENPETYKLEEVFPKSEIMDDELVIPMFWGGQLGYVTVPGTEFYGRIPEGGI
jgi:hypothetical protein